MVHALKKLFGGQSGSLAIKALEAASMVHSSPKGDFWAFRHPNPDFPPETYRLTRRDRNGWRLILAASKTTKEIFTFHADEPGDQQAVREALGWLGIDGRIETEGETVVLKLADGKTIKSELAGGEKPKKK